MIEEKEIRHLAALSRIEVSDENLTELRSNLDEILAYFEDLNKLDTKNVTPLTGGTDFVNALRSDEPERTQDTGKGVNQFPEAREGLLKVPNIF